jgi:hypothetical protein
VGLSYCCDFRANPNYSVVSTNGILSVTPIAVTVIADGKSKVYGDENLRLLPGLLLSMAIPSTIPQQLLPLNSLMLGLSYCCDLGDKPNYSVVSTNGI